MPERPVTLPPTAKVGTAASPLEELELVEPPSPLDELELEELELVEPPSPLEELDELDVELDVELAPPSTVAVLSEPHAAVRARPTEGTRRRRY